MNMADGQKTTTSKYCTLAGMLVRTYSNTLSDTYNGFNLNVSTAVDYRPDYPPMHCKEPKSKKASGSSACDPVTVLDDVEPDTAEINYIDLETDGGALTEKNCTASFKQSVAGTHGAGVPTVVKTNSPYNTTQGPDLARRTKRDASLSFRPLTADDSSDPSVQAVPEKRGIGFKAWYRKIDPFLTVRPVPEMQQKQISKNPSIALINKERTQSMTTRNCDGPQLDMNVLKSKRKRTMGELGYNELIAPAQIESPSEKLARLTKKRRQRQERCDLLQITNAGDAQSAMDSDHVYGHENDRVTGENVELTVSSTEYALCDGQEIHASVGDERSGPSIVRESPPVRPYLSNEGHRGHPTVRGRENHSDDMIAYGSRSTQNTAQGRDAQEHSNSITTAYLGDSASRKSGDQKPRIGGPTKECGVFSPEKKPPVKRSKHGAFHCPRCDSQFTRSSGVNYHFEKCIARYGNPKGLRWNDHPSLGGAIPGINERKTASASSASVPVPIQTTLTHVPIDIQIATPAPLAKVRATPLDSDTRAPTVADLSESRPTIKDHTSSSSHLEPKLDQFESLVERRATAGKGLSQETLRRFRKTGNWNCGMEMDQNAVEVQDEETEVPNIAYHYFVRKREWLETEEDAMESSLGPFLTMNEANAVAKAEVQSPQVDGYEEIQPTGWSYYYEQDEHGMQMHMATVSEIHIETAVHRSKCHSLGLSTRNTKLIRMY